MIKFQEKFFLPRGSIKMVIRKAGRIIEIYEDHNLIVNNAKMLMAHLLGGDTAGMSITKIGFGTNTTPPVPDDASLRSPFIKPVSDIKFNGFVTADVNFAPVFGLPNELVISWYGYQVQFDWVLLTTEANGHSIGEFGLISENNTLFSRKSRANPIVKESDISIEGTWIITL